MEEVQNTYINEGSNMVWSNYSRHLSIKYKFLITTFLFVIVFSIIMIYIWYSTAETYARETATTYTRELLTVSNENLEIALKDINSIISVLTVNSSDNKNIFDILKKDDNIADYEKYNDRKELSDLLTKLSNNKYYLNGIIISKPKGETFSTGITMSDDYFKSQPWYKKILNSQGEKMFIPPHYYSMYHSNSSTDEYKDMVFSYAKAIIDDGIAIGFVIADIRCEILTNIFKRNIKDKGYIYIADSKLNELIYSPATKDIPILNNKSELLNILKNTNENDGSFTIKASGKNLLIVYTKSAFTGWTTIGVVPEENLLSSFHTSGNKVILVTIIFCILALAILLLISAILTRNILKLNTAVSKINSNNLSFSANINTHDEIGQLNHQINAMVGRIKELIENITKTEKAKSRVEIKFLQSQINPHFLYNTLNTIKFISSLHGVGNIVKITDSLSTLLHVNMDERIFISVKEEIEYINSYLGIQEFKYNNIAYNIIAADGVEELMTLKLLLQPIVENSLIHGISGRIDNGIINIKVYPEGNCLKMKIQDNGVGMSDETVKDILENKIHSNGIGLNNVISRIKMYFGDKYGINIISQQNLFTIMEITIPAVTKERVKDYA